MKKLSLIAIMLIAMACFAQSFTEIATGLPGLSLSSSAWGDFDNDGDLDIVITGTTGTERISRIYRNDGSGVFTDIQAGLPGVEFGSVDWGDYDNDGYIDILMTGYTGTTRLSKIFKNNGYGSFTDIGASLVGISSGRAAWGDYNNDGKLDLLITGHNGTEAITKLYRNGGNDIFTEISISVSNISANIVSWCDFNNDELLDFAISGYDLNYNRLTKIYRNNGDDTFTDINAGLTGVSNGSLSWGDFNNDGFNDLIVTGWDNDLIRHSIVYRNNGNGTFTNINAGLTGVNLSSSCWGDYDNDGFSDILVSGFDGTNRISKLYRNLGNSTFADVSAGFVGIQSGQCLWSDFDNDGDLDVFITGLNGSVRYSTLYSNNVTTANTAPSSPGNLNSAVTGDDAVLSWNKALDNETSQNGLSYNIYIGTSSGSGNILDPMSDISSGNRKIVKTGNTGSKNSWAIKNLTNGTYYWSVQAVDNAFSGSLFSAEQSFTITEGINSYPPSQPEALEASNILQNSFTANWSSVEGIEFYSLDIAKDSLFTDYLYGYMNRNVGIETSHNVTGLIGETNYYYRLRATNSSGSSSYSNVISLITWGIAGPPPVAIEPTYITHKSFDSKWQSLSGATKYYLDAARDSLFTDYVSGYKNLDVGKMLYKNVYTLNELTKYHYRLRALVNGDTTAYSNVISLTTLKFPDPPVALEPEYVSGHTFTVDCTPVDYAWDYYFDVSTDNSFSSYTRYQVYYEWLPYPIRSLTAETQYYFRVFARVDGDSTAYSNTVPVKTHQTDFTDSQAGIEASYNYSAVGDFNNDGFLDFLVSGYYQPVIIYRNNRNGTYTNINAGLPVFERAFAVWSDLDNDGFSDLVLSGYTGTEWSTRVYKNNGNETFTVVNAAITVGGIVAVGDYNNDGWPDIAVNGKLYRNDGSFRFIETTTIPGVSYTGSYDWGDFDNDGDLDILVAQSGSYLKIYRNDGNDMFTSINIGDRSLRQMARAKWLDYDNDGNLDIIVTGHRDWGGSIQPATIYRNEGGAFSDQPIAWVGDYYYSNSVAWGDFDNDGKSEILLTGYNYSYTTLHKQYGGDNGSYFYDMTVGLPGINNGWANWGDFDNDGRLDILLTGSTIYKNNTPIANTPPTTPSNLSAVVDSTSVTLSWSKATDNETPQNGLSYNFYLGSSSSGTEIVSPMSDAATGQRRIVERGNAEQNTSWTIDGLSDGTYYWSVQAVDNGYCGVGVRA
jgi:hypothetical protein